MNILSVAEIELARVKILENAHELVDESFLLFEAGRYPRAYALAHLGLEELGKIPMLVRAGQDSVLGRPVNWKRLNQRLRNHQSKLRVNMFIPLSIKHLPKSFEDLVSAVSKDTLIESARIASKLNDLKNASLYVSVEAGSIQKPTEIVTQGDTEGVLQIARSLLEIFDYMEDKYRGTIEDVANSDEHLKAIKELDEYFKKELT